GQRVRPGGLGSGESGDASATNLLWGFVMRNDPLQEPLGPRHYRGISGRTASSHATARTATPTASNSHARSRRVAPPPNAATDPMPRASRTRAGAERRQRTAPTTRPFP